MIDLKNRKIVVCGIVRDAENGLKKNIPVVNGICSCFEDYKVVIYENNSKDGSKHVLKKWHDSDNNHVFVIMENCDRERVVPSQKEVKCNPFFSSQRIAKMASLRNKYLQYVEDKGWYPDYLMVVDLDVASINHNAILSSFRDDIEWDAVTAFGYSTSPKLTKRYHDTYALTEYGDEDKPQTEEKIQLLADKYGKLKVTDNWIRVFSAFGGLAIYRYEAIKGLRYRVIENNDKRVEVKCEHYSICQQMRKKGGDRIYINPAMVVKYQDLSLRLIINTIRRKLKL